MAEARRRERALLRGPVPAGVRHQRSTKPGSSGSHSSASSSGAISREVRKYPITPHRTLGRRRGRLDFAHRTTTSRTACSTAPSAIPGVVEHVGAINTRDGSVRRLADIKRAMHCTGSPRSPTTQASGTAFYTNDNLAHARPDGGRREDRRGADAASRTRASARSRSIPADRSLWGVRHENGIATLVRIPLPVRRRGIAVHDVSLRVRALRPRHLARRPAACRRR